MKSRRLVLCGVLFAAAAGAGWAQTILTWTGVGLTGWQNNTTLTSDPTAELLFLDSVNRTLRLDGDLTVQGLYLQSGDNFTVAPNGSITPTLTVQTLFVGPGADAVAGRLQFDPAITLSGVAALDTSAYGSIVIPGAITSASGGVLAITSDGTGAVVFNNVGAGNTYSGTTVITGTPGAATAVGFWNSAPFGTSSVIVTNSASFIAHGTQTLDNAFNFATSVANDPIYFRTWDAPLTLSGPITLSTSTTFYAQVAFSYVPAPDDSGVYQAPGPITRFPVIISGSIGQSTGAGLTINGRGLVMLTGAGNTYTGGTTVNGTLVFAPSAVPATGSIAVNAGGYVGVAAPAPGNFNAADFANLVANFNLGSAGTIGIDTLPGNTTTVLTAPISLTSFTNPAISLGTATSAILQGSIVPQGNNYQFGAGGGSLYVQSALVDVTSGFGPPSQVSVTNPAQNLPTKIYLQGTDTYTGSTTVTDSMLFFDGASALSPSGSLVAGGSLTNAGRSYIGYTDATGLTPATFLGRFNAASTWGIVGFDTTTPGSPVTISNAIDLTGFNDGVVIGTATGAILTGPLTPSTVTNTANAPDTLRLTAALGSQLTVESDLGDLNGGATPMAVMLGVPAPLTNPQQDFSDGTVVLDPAISNTYTGGTILNTNGPLTLAVGGVTPLGTGPLTVVPNGSAPVGLSAVSPVTLANDVVLQSPTGSQVPVSLYLTGAQNFTLAGNISGYGDLVVWGENVVTFSGDNSGYSGDIDILAGELDLNSNTAAGTGNLNFDSANATVYFNTPAPVLYGISGDSGELALNDGATLTFDLTNSNNGFRFGGIIGGYDSSSTTASVVVTAGTPTGKTNALYLYGQSTYTGGTTILNNGLVGIGDNRALGPGPVTLNAPGGGLAVNAGVTFTNPLTFTAGALGGYGTFAPSNLGTITFGAGQILIPGLPGLSPQAAGTLTFNANLAFANGGAYYWALQDNTRADGFSQVLVNGNLTVTAAAGGFNLILGTFDANGNNNAAVFDPNSPASWMILQTTGTITGFDPTAFTLNLSAFDEPVTANEFSLSLDGTSQQLLLSFTPVPEPSTWVLLACGLAGLGLAARRRRRPA